MRKYVECSSRHRHPHLKLYSQSTTVRVSPQDRQRTVGEVKEPGPACPTAVELAAMPSTRTYHASRRPHCMYPQLIGHHSHALTKAPTTGVDPNDVILEYFEAHHQSVQPLSASFQVSTRPGQPVSRFFYPLPLGLSPFLSYRHDFNSTSGCACSVKTGSFQAQQGCRVRVTSRSSSSWAKTRCHPTGWTVGVQY